MSEWIVDNRGVAKSGTLSAVGHEMVMACDGGANATFQVFSQASAVGCQLGADIRTSDDAPWVTCHLSPTNDLTPTSPIAQTAAFTGMPANGWRVDLQGATSFRIKVNALTSGSLVVQAKLSEEGYV